MNLKDEIKSYTIAGMMFCRSLGSSQKARALWPICGKSMLEWILKAALGSEYVDRIYVISEDEGIRKEARDCGARTINRPINEVLDYPVDLTEGIRMLIKPRSMVHQKRVYISYPYHYSIQYLWEVEHYVPDILLNLGADQPLMTTDNIDKLLEVYFKDNEASSAVSVYKVDPGFLIRNEKTGRLFPIFQDAWQNIDRQEYPNIYKIGGPGVSGGWKKWSTHSRLMAWNEIDPDEGFSVHTKRDLFIAECLMKRRLEGKDV